MEQFIYSIIKGVSAVYLLHRVFRFLFGKHAERFWRFLRPETPVKEKTPVPVPETAPHNIVGKSRTVYLQEAPPEGTKAVEPAFRENLQREKAYEDEPDITADDVEENLGEEIPQEDERFIPLDTEPDGEAVSTGMTFEQISEALDVVQGRQKDEAGKTATARILYEIEGSELFDFLAAQAENEAIIEKLLKENLDNNSVSPPENIRKRKRDTEEFDMTKYV
jgi:hypothetical protein